MRLSISPIESLDTWRSRSPRFSADGSPSSLSVRQRAAPARGSLGMFRAISDSNELSSTDVSGSAMVMVGSHKQPSIALKSRLSSQLLPSPLAVDKNGDNPRGGALDQAAGTARMRQPIGLAVSRLHAAHRRDQHR